MQAGKAEGLRRLIQRVRPKWFARSRQDNRSPYKATTTLLKRTKQTGATERGLDRLTYAFRLVLFACSNATCHSRVGSVDVPDSFTRLVPHFHAPLLPDSWLCLSASALSLGCRGPHLTLRYLSMSNERPSCTIITG